MHVIELLFLEVQASVPQIASEAEPSEMRPIRLWRKHVELLKELQRLWQELAD